ncbi:MAG: DMT family transporter [Kiritimatiellae bacterium]|nr:DMT family transporter [Kiritimatiellia bacterium]
MTKAILLLFATGLSWVSVGAAVGHVERRGYNLVRYQILLCVVCVVFGLAGWAAAPTAFLPQDGAPALTWTLVIAATLLCGVFNYLMNMMMGRAMKSGPNAIVWAIIQSGLIYPFLMGWLVFGVPMGIGRFCGITLIVASVFLYAFRGDTRDGARESGQGKECGNVKVWKQPTANVEMREWGTGNRERGVGGADNCKEGMTASGRQQEEGTTSGQQQEVACGQELGEGTTSGRQQGWGADNCKEGRAESMQMRLWLPAALLGMLFCGINQCAANLPSYLEKGSDFSGTFRTFAIYFGLLMAALAHLAIQRMRGQRAGPMRQGELRSLAVWAIGVGLVSFLTSKYLAFPGLDTLERLGAGSMGYPVMVAACIIGFFPYGLIVLRERINVRQAIGAVLGLAGILLGCLA